ncbi:peroxidase 5-like [Silene latifolia]|uniref:peroxidase 5-like n=1 Tax=Silene latifolia TaxID=37657 RepID=UPI003D76C3D5
MPAGRRDSGFVDGNLAVNLPGGNFNTKDLIRLYADRGLTVDDMVILEGAHSVGEAKCVTTIVDDLNLANVTGSAEIIDNNFRDMMLKKYCPKANESNWSEIPVPMIADKSGSGLGSGSAAWGVSFFNNIIKGKGVITSDVPFAVYPSTKDLVRQYANDSALWMKKFGETMVKLGKMDVLTGEQGEIRRHCSVQNAANMHA